MADNSLKKKTHPDYASLQPKSPCQILFFQGDNHFLCDVQITLGHPSDTHLPYDLIVVIVAVLKSVCPTDFLRYLHSLKDLTSGHLISTSPNFIAVDWSNNFMFAEVPRCGACGLIQDHIDMHLWPVISVYLLAAAPALSGLTLPSVAEIVSKRL